MKIGQIFRKTLLIRIVMITCMLILVSPLCNKYKLDKVRTHYCKWINSYEWKRQPHEFIDDAMGFRSSVIKDSIRFANHIEWFEIKLHYFKYVFGDEFNFSWQEQSSNYPFSIRAIYEWENHLISNITLKRVKYYKYSCMDSYLSPPSPDADSCEVIKIYHFIEIDSMEFHNLKNEWKLGLDIADSCIQKNNINTKY